MAVIVSVYAAGAVPGSSCPACQAAFLTSAAFAVVAFVVALAALGRRVPAAAPAPAPEPELAEAA